MALYSVNAKFIINQIKSTFENVVHISDLQNLILQFILRNKIANTVYKKPFTKFYGKLAH